MYPLPKKVSYQHQEYFHAEYLLVPEYNSFGKPKWPKIITVEQKEEIYKNLCETNLPIRFHEGPIPIKPTDLEPYHWRYFSVEHYTWGPSEYPPNKIDPFDKRNEFYIVDENLK